MNLIKEPYNAQVNFNLAQIQQRLPNSWKNVEVQMEVCDDTNQDGTCSDKGAPWVLSVGTEQFTLGHMPPSLALDVWSGRNYLLATNPDVCDVQYSPLVLDLTGAGFTLTSPENGVYFDLNDSGTAVRTGCRTGANNVAFLVRDINHNGMIDNGGELFGSATLPEERQSGGGTASGPRKTSTITATASRRRTALGARSSCGST